MGQFIKQRGPEKERSESVYQNSEARRQKGVRQFIKTERHEDIKVWVSLSKQ